MNKNLIKEIIREFQETELPQLIQRETVIPLTSNKIVVLIGPRRSGKTYLLFSLMKNLIEEGFSKEQLIYISFDNPLLMPFESKDINLIIEAYREMYPEYVNKVNYIFLDEIQNVKEWELAVRFIHDTRKFKIFLTGSSSKLLSKEIATQLRGRAIGFQLFPFSFKELLKANNIKTDRHLFYSQERYQVIKHLEEYFKTGGFPEVVLEDNTDLKIRILKEYIETMFFRDLIERYRVKNQVLLRELMRFLATNIANIFSLNSFYRFIKGTHPHTPRTLLNYLTYLEDIGFFYFIKKFSYSLKEQTRTLRKCYIVDNGIYHVYGFKFSENKGKILENTVFLELKNQQAKNPLMEIFYWQDNQKREVDFVVKEGKEVKTLIQVSDNLDNIKTREREINSLLKASEELRCNQLLVITSDTEADEKIKGKEMRFLPLWKWLLS
ncbi:MAG: hypothetical protein DDT40_00318 [candidate division WS2 bacterium]|uniref:ATP-binding protein n=1 Tax=Psychracetigena formicireducens TaxID=2986056 RepID=A0A9E2BEW6_PSYF1|nr:hypothetical protein [Candidatus Psychracetigena formicireducens]MBT9144348.1 hypothetical protein [Candidatus Psychracetigena formicireducens]MBT9150152.1 hypothetical protein [Candidatus Psychracetigena formicireducens]